MRTIEKISDDVVQPMLKISLTPSDYDMPNFYGIVILLFTKPNVVPYSEFKSSLARVLVEFRQVAGRLSGVDGPGRGFVELNDKGVSLVEARAPDSTLEDIVSTRDFTGLLPMVDPVPEQLFLAQYTTLGCGGIALSACGNHMLLDASAFWSFLYSWAKVARGDHLDIAFLQARCAFMPRSPLKFPENFLKQEHSPSLQTLVTPNATALAVVHFTRDEIQALKTKLGQEDASLTTFDCLAGHLWKCAVRSHALVRGKPSTSISFLVNVRKLLSLPKGYFGNAIWVAEPSCNVQELLDRPTSFASKLIHSARTGLDVENIRSYIDAWEYFKLKGEFLHYDTSKVDFCINSWVGFPMYECNFGGGNPEFSSIAHKISDRNIFIQPSNSGGMEVHLGMEQEYLNLMLHYVNNL